MNKRWKIRPPGSNWGEFGGEDEIGRLNLLTPEKVRQGVAEVKEGRRFCLSLPLDYPGGNVLSPQRHPPRRFSSVHNGGPIFNYACSLDDERWTDVVSDDAVLLFTQYSTQWDSLAHIGARFDADGDGTAESVYYNGWRAGADIVAPDCTSILPDAPTLEGSCAKRLGIETMAATAIQGRGVMVDLRAHCGDERRLVGYDELMRIMAADRVEVEQGDMVCLHTGLAGMIFGMGGQPTEAIRHACAMPGVHAFC